MSENKKPTEVVELPSKGLLYPKENPLSIGQVEIYYMTAQSEDILTNQNYIKQGTVIDKLLQSLIATKINYDDLLIGDKNSILISARILGYGKDYEFEYGAKKEKVSIDLSELKEKHPDTTLFKEGVNEFTFSLPLTKSVVTFKILTNKDENEIDAELKGLKKINPNNSFEITTRLKHMITSVDGKRETKDIREFVDNQLRAQDSRALRAHYAKVSPDVDLTFNYVDSESGDIEENVSVPITVDFFWPKS